MKALSATLKDLTSARVLAEVPVVIIRPVTDHSVPTLEDPELASTYPMVRTLVGVEASNTPFLQSVEFPVETMSHLPSSVPGGVDSLVRRIRFSLINRPYRTFASYFDYLTRDAPLDRADLELELATVPPREMGIDPAHLNFIDFQGASQGEETLVFSGRVERVTAVGDTIQCEGRTVLPAVPWKVVPDDGSDPRDRGVRLPFALGQNAIVRCVNLDIGAVASTGDTVAIGDDTVRIGIEATGVLPGVGSAMLGAEAISWTSRAGNLLLGVVRGELGTTEAIHVIGTIIVERAPIVLGVSSSEAVAVVGIFIRSFTTGATIEVPDLLYSVDYSDEATAPGASGEPIVTATLDAVQLPVLINLVLASAAVTTQAEYEGATVPTEATDTDATITADNTTVAVATGALGTWTSVTTTPTWTRAGGGTQEVLRTVFSNNLTGTAKAVLKEARFGFDINVTTLTQTEITVGLQVSGAEAALIGMPDGTIVASVEVTSTGAINNIFGPMFKAAEDATVGDLYDVLVDVTKGEVSGGNPTVVFTIGATRIEVTYFSDSVDSAQSIDSVVLGAEGATQSEISPFWNSTWTDVGTQVEALRDDAETRKGWATVVATDPVGPLSPERGASIVDDSTALFRINWSEVFGSGNSSTTVNVECEPVGDWSNFADKPAKWTSSGAADGTNIGANSAVLTGLKRNVRSSDLIGVGFDIRVDGGQDADEIVINLDLIANYEFADPGFALSPRVIDAEIESSAGGIGLEFFALVDGPVAPDATYSVSSGVLLVHPSDLIRFWLQEVGGFAAADVDDTTFDDAVTNLVGYDWGFDARNLGANWESILLRMGYESRANVARPSGGDWKMLTANTSFQFGSAVATVDSHEGLNEIHKDDKETRSRLTVYFEFDPRFESADNRSFRQVQTTDPLDAAVIAREDEFGRNDAEPYFLFCHNGLDAAGVTDWRKYMEQELGRGARVFAARVDHWQAYPLELGDVVTFVTPSGSTKTRVIEVDPNRQNGFQLRFVEVL